MADLKTYSLIIAWDDEDEEQGTFGDTVRAYGTEHAERIVRARMIKSHWANHREEGESRRESLASYSNFDGTYFGTVMECSEGAIWKAADMEKALRGLLKQVDEMAARAGWSDHGEREAARKVLDEIDGL